MCQLLDDVRASSSEAGHTDRAAPDLLIGVRPKNDCREKRSLLTGGPLFENAQGLANDADRAGGHRLLPARQPHPARPVVVAQNNDSVRRIAPTD